MTIRLQDRSLVMQRMAANWPIVESLLGGTQAMRRAGRQFLPQWPAEEDAAYKMRLETATLYPALRRTLSVMAGKPFARQLTVSDDVNGRVADLLDNVDRQNTNLHSFALRLMREALAYGICGVLVEHDRRPEGIGNRLDLEKQIGLRPYLSFYGHDSILGWRSVKVNGRHRLTQLRLKEIAAFDDGPYGEKTVERVRVLEPGRWMLYEQNVRSEYVLVDEGTTAGVTEIPFVPFYGLQTGFMEGKSPLLDLAYLNVKHWQSQSDQDNILHVARVPVLAAVGLTEEHVLRFGASSAVILPMNGSLSYVEHSGAAVQAGAVSLQALEQQMVQTGAELLMQGTIARTATESANDAEANKSELLAIAESFEDSLDQCLAFMAQWLGLPPEHGGHVSLYKDFGAASLSEASAQLVLSMQGAGIISKQTAIREQQRRGLLAADIDPELEIETVEQETPSIEKVDG